mgnify:CR=1 FL=1
MISRTAAQVRSDIGAGTGNGTVTSVTLGIGTSGTDVNVSNATITTSGTITLNIPDASATARGLVTTGTQTFAGAKTFSSTITGNITGSAGSASTVTGATGQLLTFDNRIIAPNETNATYLQFGFTTWNNNNSSPYADYLHMRSWSDNTGGNDNLLMFRKDALGIRIWQQTFGSSTAYSSYKDVCWTDGSNTSGTWTINTTGSAATLTTSRNIWGQSFNGSADVTGSLTSVGNITGSSGITITAGGSNQNITLTPSGSGYTLLNGFVGIGTTVPTSALHICFDGSVFPSQNVARIVSLSYSGITGAHNWALRGVYQYSSGVANNTSGGDLDLIKSLDRNTILATKTDGTALGNVGVGLTTPANRLVVSGAASIGSATYNTAAPTNGLIVEGNVGIGTTSPVAKFQVAGAGIFASEILNSSIGDIGWVNAKFTDYSDGHGIYISSLQAGGGKWISGEGRYWNSGFWRSTSTTSTAISLDSGIVKFYTNSGLTANSNFTITERMRIASDGNIGIGATNPVQKLHVESAVGNPATSGTSQNGIVRLSNNTDNAVLDIGMRSGGNGAWLQSTDKTSLAANYSLLLNPNGGNVGIGVTSALFPLQIRRSGGSGSLGINVDNYFGGSTRDVLFKVTPDVVSDTGGFLFRTYNATDVNALTILAAGNVGIGTTNPSQKLDVNGNIAIQASGILGSGAGYGCAGCGSYTTLELYNSSTGHTNLNNQSFVINLQTAGTSRLTILNNGNVGIGATSPAYVLDINGVTRFQNLVRFKSDVWNVSDSDGRARFYFANAGRTYFGSSNGYEWRSSTDNALAVLTNAGDVGIGTTSPGGKLDVALTYANLTASSFGLDLKVTELSGGWARSHRIYNTNYTTVTSFFGMLGGVSSVDYAYWTIDNPASVDTTGYNSTKGIFLLPAGNVGIGVTNPSQKLHVAGSLRVTGAFYDSNNDAGTSGQILKSTATGTDWVDISSLGVDGTGTTNYITKWLDSNTITNSLLFDNGTNVGIGTSSPAQKLQVIGDIGFTGGITSRMLVSYTNLTNGEDWANSPISLRERDLVNSTQSADKYAPNLNFHWGNRVSKSLWMDSTGILSWGEYDTNGIPLADGYFKTGDINFISTLKFNGVNVISNTSTDVYVNARVIRNDSASVQDGMYIGYNSTGTTAAHIRFFANATNERMRIDANTGNVGIGTTTPAAKLHIQAANGVAASFLAGPDPLTAVANAYIYAPVATGFSGVPVYRFWYQNCGLGNPDSETLALYTNNTEKVRLSASGNVGIGVTSPAAKLHVSADQASYSNDTAQLILTGLTSVSKRLILGYNTTTDKGFIQSTNTTSNYTDLLLNPNSGNVGIGTTSPATLLQVGTGTPTSATAGIQFGSDTGARLYRDTTTRIRTSGDFSVAGYIQTSNNNIYPNDYTVNLLLNVGNSAQNAWINGLAISPGGNVAVYNNLTAVRLISTQTTGTAPLTVSSTTVVSNLNADLLDGLHSSGFFIQSGSWAGDLTSNGFIRESGMDMTGNSEFVILSKGGQGYVLVDGSYYAYEAGGFYSSYDSTYANLVGFKADSTTSILFNPAKTTFTGSATAEDAIKTTNGRLQLGHHNSGSGIWFDISGTARYWFAGTDTNNTFRLYRGVDYFAVTNTGNVGIGTSSPAVLLHIGGSSQTTAAYGLRFGLDSNANLYRSASTTIKTDGSFVVAGTLTELSALKYKENITPLSNVLEQVCKIQPISYNKKGEVRKEYGVIAEEINELFPELISRDADGEIESVNYSRLTALLIQAVKELKCEVDRLKNK